MDNQSKIELFETAPVHNAVLTMAVPTVVSQIISVIYNMADVFFIGQTGDPNQVAAANICLPFFLMITALSNLFGIGGSSLISRSMGAGNPDKAKRAASFSIWGALISSLFYGILIYFSRGILLPVFGANAGTYDYCVRYLFWTVLIGAVPSVMNAGLAHIVRAEGYSKQASFGMTMGALLNIVLDPLFILILQMQIEGAAFATMLSNLVATAYFVMQILHRKDSTVIRFRPIKGALSDGIPGEVLLTGLPSALMSVMSSFSNTVLNRLLSAYCNEAVAGVGIAKKIDFLSLGVATGIAQGVVPLVGYNYSSRNLERMKAIIRATLMLCLCFSVVCAVLLFTCARPIVRAFIDDELTVQYGQHFQRVICITGPCISVAMVMITIFQAVGKKFQPLFLSLLRKGGLDVPFMLLLNPLLGVNGIIWATPIADTLSMLTALAFFVVFWKKELRTEMKLS